MATIKKYTFEIYLDKANEFRWLLKAPNGRKIANGGEGYKRKINAGKSMHRLFEVMDKKSIRIVVKDLTKWPKDMHKKIIGWNYTGLLEDFKK